MMMNFKKCALVAIAALSLSGLTSSMVGAAPPASSTNKQETFNGRGSDTTFGAMQKVGAVYNGAEGCRPDTANVLRSLWINCLASGGIDTENYDHDSSVEHDPFLWGSSNGIRHLCAQNTLESGIPVGNTVPTELARSSRKPGSGDCTGLTFYGFARDALIPINWRSLAGSPAASPSPSGVNNLTQAQLKAIFGDCSITTWGQLNGNAADTTLIDVWGVQPGSGTFQTWNEFLGTNNSAYPAGANQCVTPGDPDGVGPLTTRIIQENDAQPILNQGATVAGRSLWYMSYGPWQSNLNVRASSSIVRVNGLSPSGANIQNGSFPTGRYLYEVAVTPGDPQARIPATRVDNHKAAAGFVEWLCRDSTGHSSATGKNYASQIQNAVNSEGFYPNLDTADPGPGRCVNLTT
ncbi:MAG: PstS family phosphate ABC transporter substrate-binding protein [Acidimicrobiales bacterium]